MKYVLKYMSPMIFPLAVLLIDSCAIVIAVLLGNKEVGKYFKEGQFITILSFVQLLMCSGIAWKVFEHRRGLQNRIKLSAQYSIWAIFSAGFLYLSIDEIALLHENMDKLIHYIFDMKETALSDRIDDIIVAGYAIGGALIVYYYRMEFKRFPHFFVYIFMAFAFMFGKIVVDIITNRNDILPMFYGTETLVHITPWFIVIEGACKLFGQVFIMTAFYSCYIITKNRLISTERQFS